jgi:hypothetical protein
MVLIVASLTLSIMLVAGANVGAQVWGKEKRSHFGVRVALSLLAAPAVQLVVVEGAALHVFTYQASIVAFMLMILCSPALLLLPSVLYRNPDSAPGDAGPGGGSDPGEPPSQPDRPSGDLPLPYADPGRWRVRDHRPDLGHAVPRRSAPEPERAPVSASPGNPHLRP